MNKLYKILVGSYIVSGFAEGILLPIYAIFVQRIGGDILEATGAMALFLIAEGIFTIIIHKLKWSQKHRIHLLIGGWAIWTLGIALYLTISNVAMLFLTQVVTALGNAIADPAFDRELASHTDKNLEEYEWGFFEGSKSIMDGFAALLGGIVASFFGFKALIYVMIGFATASLIMILFYLKRRKLHGV